MNDAVRGVELAAEFANVISLRTFSKAYARCGPAGGLRLAWRITGGLDGQATPFGVNTPAQVAAVAALQERGEVEPVRGSRQNDLNWLAPYGCLGGRAVRRAISWFDLGAESARFAHLCEREKLVVRTFAEGVR